ncbi:hypothetical protein L3X38_012153 [Prunus dulcis]|uniref:Uncharacterized protein n=1 Tax=Prunus dulcis TaxID=3755 RepID=A0AAD4WJH1_PRUDU|nr:hypothetical protein L3X38_012153 [Prunus dulcis]
MSNLAKLEFVALDISGKNYFSWINDAEVHLEAMNLGETIKEGNEASSVDQAKAMIFLKRHIHEGLKCEYLTNHASNVILQQQYRERGFHKYSDFISCLLLPEQNNELLLQNHQSRPTRFALLHEVNAALAPSHEAYATSSHGDRR